MAEIVISRIKICPLFPEQGRLGVRETQGVMSLCSVVVTVVLSLNSNKAESSSILGMVMPPAGVTRFLLQQHSHLHSIHSPTSYR